MFDMSDKPKLMYVHVVWIIHHANLFIMDEHYGKFNQWKIIHNIN